MKPLTRADARPRIHIFADGARARFRHGPTGMLHEAESVGDAVERAIGAIEGRDAVIIYSAGGGA
jgi:hypothetical protein